MPPENDLTTIEYRGGADRSIRLFWDGGTRQLPLPRRGELLVGRGDDCAVRVPHESVSRQHCRLFCGVAMEVEDLGSANGTQVGGVRAEPGQRLGVAPGVAVQLGAAVLYWESVAKRAEPDAQAEDPDVPTVVPGSRLAEVLELAAKYARGDLPVLVEGETGTGKEIVASHIQRCSPRGREPYVRINCAALPENLLESELMGYERGAFTGATHARPGLLEVASGGTLLLDEVAELPLGLQAKLLRVVDNQEVLRVGGRSPRRVNVRFISATNRALSEFVADGRFRSDLFYRLAGARVTVPPLRERQDETLLLARRFLREHAGRLGLPATELGAGVAEAISGYPWPGNVRELRSAMERALLVAQGGAIELEALGLPDEAGVTGEVSAAPGEDGDETARIQAALAQAGGNQKLAAEALGISRRTLLRRLDKLGLARPRKRGT